MTSDELATALGRAVAAVWDELPAEVQHELFAAAVILGGRTASEDLAVFLHHWHPRTSDIREVPEPDSLGG